MKLLGKRGESTIKKVLAFYDLLLYLIICIPLIIIAIFIMLFAQLDSFSWDAEYWCLILLLGLGISIPVAGIFFIRRYDVEHGENVFFRYCSFIYSFGKFVNNIDDYWNVNMFISEIKSVDVVKLTKEEKTTKVHYKHWFNKYLKIDLKYGNPKYVYVGNYSRFQIKKMCKILTSKLNIKNRI